MVLGRAAIFAWAAAALVMGSFLLAGHVVALPGPGAGAERALAVWASASPDAKGRWAARHVLYQSCGCSNRVLARLLARGARADVTETVVYVSDAAGADAAAIEAVRADVARAGFRFEPVTPVELERRYSVESAPLLLVTDGEGRLLYNGGYTDRSGGVTIADASIINDLRAGRQVDPLPIFGCAVSSRVQRAIDPLGLKYGRGAN
jgi:hypothetical protein